MAIRLISTCTSAPSLASTGGSEGSNSSRSGISPSAAALTVSQARRIAAWRLSGADRLGLLAAEPLHAVDQLGDAVDLVGDQVGQRAVALVELARDELRRAADRRERVLDLVREHRRAAQRRAALLVAEALALPRIGQRDHAPARVRGQRRDRQVDERGSPVDLRSPARARRVCASSPSSRSRIRSSAKLTTSRNLRPTSRRALRPIRFSAAGLTWSMVRSGSSSSSAKVSPAICSRGSGGPAAALAHAARPAQERLVEALEFAKHLNGIVDEVDDSS